MIRHATHIEVYDLGDQCSNDKGQQDVNEPILELRVGPPNLCGNGGTKTLRCDDAQATDETADAEIHQHALLAVPRSNP